MPDNIAIIGGQAAMAYQNETPWHGLGQKGIYKTVEEAMVAARLDWLVQVSEMYVKLNGEMKEVPIRRAVVRDLDGEILGTVGADYAPLQNHEAFGVLTPAMEEFGVEIETAGALGKGERVWMLAKLPESEWLEPVKGDKVAGYFLITTGHDGATPYIAIPTPVRVVCQNTLTLALRTMKAMIVKLSHTRNAVAQMDQVASMIKNLIGALKLQGESFTKLAAKKITPDQVDDYINAVLGIPDMENISGIIARRHARIKDLVENGRGNKEVAGTAWAAYNGVTEYVDHVRPAETKTTKAARQANESALFGRNAYIKSKALDLALAL